MAQLFDKFSRNYKSLLDESLQSTGFDTDYFSSAKIRTLARLFPEFCHRPIRFLDFGCGNGSLRQPVTEFFPQAAYIGTDLSEDMVQQARTLNNGSDAYFELESEAWRQDNYDVIFAANVFHHIPDADHLKIFKELSSLLAPKGKLILWEHNPWNPFTRKIVKDCVFDKDAVLLSPLKSKRLFQKTGFSQFRIVFTTFFPKSLKFMLSLEPRLEWLPLGGQYLIIGENPDQKAIP
jgi:SAM-dependent methyltransferase